MVGLLSGMENEDRSSAVAQGNKDVEVGAAQEESNAPKSSADESQTDAENTDNLDEVEQVKELKSILKQRGQYTFRKVKVDFDLIPKKIPYDEDDYTIEIQIVEKEPVKIKSWAAIFAAKKAEAEAEAAAIAEAEEALKKAEEVQKREALKRANKAKLKKSGEYSEPSVSLSREQNKQESASSNISPPERTIEHTEPESSNHSANENLQAEPNEYQEPREEPSEQKETNYNTEPIKLEEAAQFVESREPTVNYQLAESIVKEVLDAIIIPEDVLSQDVDPESKEVEPHGEERDEEESSCTESLAAERSENLQEEHTNDDLEEISTQEEASVSQLLDDSNTEESSSQEVCHSHVSHTVSDLEEKSSEEDASVSRSEDKSSKISHSDDSSSKLVELQGKQIPKKLLVTAASLVEEILSEMPAVIQTESKDNVGPKELIPMLSENPKTEKTLRNEVEPEFIDANLGNDIKNKSRDVNLESGARRKRREFKKSNDSKIFEHVKKSLESAAPEILETAVGVLDEIEKIVVDKVGSAIL